MVRTVGLVSVVFQAVASKEARSSFVVVEMAALTRAGSYFGRLIMLAGSYEVVLHSSEVLEVHSNHSL
jgi:hypothetical protein